MTIETSSTIALLTLAGREVGKQLVQESDVYNVPYRLSLAILDGIREEAARNGAGTEDIAGQLEELANYLITHAALTRSEGI